MSRYDGKVFHIDGHFSLFPSRESIIRALVTYGGAIARTARLFRYLKMRYSGRLSEIELSVDESESPTTPFEHFFIANELMRLGVSFVSLAPRFIGSFAKGIDYKGDIIAFKEEYLRHSRIAVVPHPRGNCARKNPFANHRAKICRRVFERRRLRRERPTV